MCSRPDNVTKCNRIDWRIERTIVLQSVEVKRRKITSCCLCLSTYFNEASQHKTSAWLPLNGFTKMKVQSFLAARKKPSKHS